MTITTIGVMNRKDGEYYYAPHGRHWGVWQHHDLGNGLGSGTFQKDFPTKDEARNEVYILNGWGEPKSKK